MKTKILPISLLSLALAGCAGVNKYPQSREEFVSDMQAGGVFRNKDENITVRRPVKAVLADLRRYSDQCLNVRVTRKLPEEGITSTTYHPKFTTGADGVTWFVLQETYQGDKPSPGHPPGGMYSFVADLRAAGPNATRVDAYWITSRGKVLDSMKTWMEQRKGSCPSFH